PVGVPGDCTGFDVFAAPPPQEAMKTTLATISASANQLASRRRRWIAITTIPKTGSELQTAYIAKIFSPARLLASGAKGCAALGARVEIVSTVLPPAAVTVARFGVKTQVVPDGNPDAQLKLN